MVENIAIDVVKEGISCISVALVKDSHQLVKIVVNAEKSYKIAVSVIYNLTEGGAVKTCLFIKIGSGDIEVAF